MARQFGHGERNGRAGGAVVDAGLAVGIADLQAADDEEAPDQAVQGEAHGVSGECRAGICPENSNAGRLRFGGAGVHFFRQASFKRAGAGSVPVAVPVPAGLGQGGTKLKLVVLLDLLLAGHADLFAAGLLLGLLDAAGDVDGDREASPRGAAPAARRPGPSDLIGWSSTTWLRLTVSPDTAQPSAMSRLLTEPYRLPLSPAWRMITTCNPAIRSDSRSASSRRLMFCASS